MVMLTEVILLYNYTHLLTPAAAWSSLASAHHRVHHFGIGPGESASRDGVLRLFRSRAWKSIGKRFSQLLDHMFVFRYFVFT